MAFLASHRPTYSRAERLSDAVVHVTGLTAALAAVPVLIFAAASLRGDAAAIFGTSVYGATLLAMIGCSALFNMTSRADWAWVLQRLDHGAIYLKIAGTYTPFALMTGQGGGLAAAIWVAAAVGVVLKAISPARFRLPALALYLGMGWAAALAGQAMLGALPAAVVTLMIVGGGLYSLGVVFYLWQPLKFHYTIWHLFVLAATAAFYAAILLLTLHDAGQLAATELQIHKFQLLNL